MLPSFAMISIASCSSPNSLKHAYNSSIHNNIIYILYIYIELTVYIYIKEHFYPIYNINVYNIYKYKESTHTIYQYT